jgi:hypothetical protein
MCRLMEGERLDAKDGNNELSVFRNPTSLTGIVSSEISATECVLRPAGTPELMSPRPPWSGRAIIQTGNGERFEGMQCLVATPGSVAVRRSSLSTRKRNRGQVQVSIMRAWKRGCLRTGSRSESFAAHCRYQCPFEGAIAFSRQSSASSVRPSRAKTQAEL